MTDPISTAPTIPALMDDAVARTPDAPFLVTPEGTWSFAQVRDTADQLARALRTIGVGPGDRVALAAPNCAEWIITLIGATRVRATVLALNVLYREAELDYMLNESGATVLICAAEHHSFDFVSFLDDFRKRLPGVNHYVFLHGAGFSTSRTWQHLIDAAPDLDTAWEPVGIRTPAVLLYTSGTTGAPKGAMLTHASLLASARAQAAHLRQRPDDAVIAHMPFNHVGGLTCTVLAAMTVGARLILVPGFHPQQSLAAIVAHGATMCVGVPTMFALMMAEPTFADADLSRVRTCVIGGSNVDPDLGRRVIDAFPGARLANLYGLSETSGGCIISAEGDDLDTLVETLGVPIGDFRARVVDADDNEVDAGIDGELQIAGDCVAAGYWQRPDATTDTFGTDGWLRTGDMATTRPDGHIVLRGRRKEMYVRGGYNVYPTEVEHVLTSHPHVELAAVIGVPDETYGEVGVAFVVIDDAVDVAELRALCAEQLARYKQPEKILVVDSLPLTPSGKIKKADIKKRHLSSAG
ncbi:long-chain fatty acid--CoA ligase [Gordonia oryzae]|uniref:Long-chain fatty acid--CoA ligase n=1 Tax=Gordonia oryzae TaxID=2487349 RepID=A0A3N4GJU8_9ACTN|nr:class I adenylate-forming enzyme family protein [Gordonia oryzae]RPA59401.1 long-chain fatty acid--CoA ligase [Gordonia oryzae]